MKSSNIILAGVGGQGILTIAATIGMATLTDQLNFKQSEVHGMSQRGGAVQSHFRISENPVYSDLIPLGQADLILSVEPLETLRYLPFLKSEGWLICNSVPFINVPDYPDLDEIHQKIRAWENHMIIDADRIALNLGSKKASNMVVLGAASSHLCLNFDSLELGIRQIFSRKGDDIVKLNLEALRAGRDLALQTN